MRHLNLFILTSILLSLAIACGGGGGGSTSSTETVTKSKVRMAGGKEGDSLIAYELSSGNLVGYATFDATGSTNISLNSGNTYILKYNLDGTEVLETIVRRADFTATSISVALNSATTWATHKVMALNPNETSIGSIFSNATGLTSIKDLTLSNAPSMLSANRLEEVRLFSLVSNMVITSMNESSFSGNWLSISDNLLNSFEIESTASAETVLSSATELADILRTEITLSSKIAYADLDDGLQAIIGSEAASKNILAGLQTGDASATLTSISLSNDTHTASELYQLGVTAMEDEDMLEAYQFFTAAVQANQGNEKARFLLATTRLMTLSMKGSREAKEFLELLDLDFDFLDNNHLFNDDGDDIDSIDTTIYDDPDDITSIFSYNDLRDFVQDVLISEIELSISDLNQISGSAFTTDLVITPAMQGEIDEDEFGEDALPTSSILVDGIDARAVKAGLELLRVKLLYLLSHNFEIENENDSGTAMKDFLIQWAYYDSLFLEGESTYSLSGTSIRTTFTFKSGYPDEILLTEDTPDGDKNILDVEALDSEGISNFHSFYSSLGISDPLYMISGDLFLVSNGTNTLLNVGGAFEGNTFDSFSLQVTESTDPDGDGNFTFSQSYTIDGTKSTGTLNLHSTYEPINGNKFLDFISADSTFATISGNYNELARTSFSNALTITIGVLESLQSELDSNTNRIDHIIDSLDNLERDDNSTFSMMEVNKFQTFLTGVNEALSTPSNVNPDFLVSDWTTQELDLRGAFSTNLREMFVDGTGSVIAGSDRNPVTADIVDETLQGESHVLGRAINTGNTASNLYSKFFTNVDDWLAYGPPVSNPTIINPTLQNPTRLTGTAVYSDEWNIIGTASSGNEAGSYSIAGSSTPGEVTITSGSQTFTGYINGLSIYYKGADTSNGVAPFSNILTFTDSSFSEGVQLSMSKATTSDIGLAEMEVAKFSLSSGSLSATNLGSTAVNGSANLTHHYKSITDQETGSNNLQFITDGSSFIDISDPDTSLGYNLHMYYNSFTGARVHSSGNYSILIGFFDKHKTVYTGLEVGFAVENTSFSWADAVFGEVDGLISVTHNPVHSYTGNTLTVSSAYTPFNESTEVIDSNITFDITEEALDIDSGSGKGVLMGPIMFFGSHSFSDHSLHIYNFDDSVYTNYYSPSAGFDSGGSWSEFQHGSKVSGDLTRD